MIIQYPKTIGVIGFKGSGKNETANFMQKHHDFRIMGFSDALKDSVAVMFGWDREMLEGTTPESREWRETVQEWWAEELQIPGLTPRIVLQRYATDAVRDNFSKFTWLAIAKKRVIDGYPQGAAIPDTRFPNEIQFICGQKGELWWVRRAKTETGQFPQLPDFFRDAFEINIRLAENPSLKPEDAVAHLAVDHFCRDQHYSEWAFIRPDILRRINKVFYNEGTINELHEKVKAYWNSCQIGSFDEFLNSEVSRLLA